MRSVGGNGESATATSTVAPRSLAWVMGERFAPVLVLFAAFVLRLANLTGESLWRDEIDSVRFAFEPLAGILRNFTANGFNGPLYHLGLRVWLTLAGISDFTLRSFSLVFGTLLVALVFALGKRLFGRRSALVAMVLAAVSPVFIWYSGEGKMYTLQPALLTLSLYALARAAGDAEWRKDDWGAALAPSTPNSTKRWWAVFIIATSLSFYTHLLSPIFLAVAVLFFVALWPNSRRHLRGGLIALALLTLPYAPLALWQSQKVIQGGDVGHVFYTLDIMAHTLLSNWTVGLDGNAPLLNMPVSDSTVQTARWLVLVLFLALAAYGVLEARLSGLRASRLAWAVLAWLLLPTVIVYVVSLRFPIFQPRYLLWCAPALYLLAGLGVARVSREGVVGKWAGRIALLLFSVASLSGWVSQVINPIRPDLRGANTFLASHVQPQDKIVFQIPYARFGYEYYAQRAGITANPAQIIEAPYTNYGMSDDEVAVSMFNATGGARRVWLMETESTMWDLRGLVHAWADRTLITLDRREYRGVTLSLYEWPATQ